jgi:hypothetical protein
MAKTTTYGGYRIDCKLSRISDVFVRTKISKDSSSKKSCLEAGQK